MVRVLLAILLAISGRSSDAAGFPETPSFPLTFLSKARAAEQLDASNPVHSRDTFVHLFEWSWSDIAQECEEWLAPKGYTAVQISPPNDHKVGPEWWVRYQPVTYNLTSRSGDEAAFKDMIDRCKAVGVGIYADAVINHIARGDGISIAGNAFGNRTTPIYSPEEFHHFEGDLQSNCGIPNYTVREPVQNCDLVGLPDLCTGCASVQQKVADYLNYMGSLGLAGFRVDASKHMAATELNDMLSLVDSDLYVFHEVIGNDAEPIKTDEYFFPASADVTEFAYFFRLHSNIGDQGAQGKLQYLETLGESWNILPEDKAVVFIDNHDTTRSGYHGGLNYKDGDWYTLYNVFMLAHPYGYPKVMSSYYFVQEDFDQGPPANSVHDGDGTNRCMDDTNWVCEHRWTSIANMVNWRRAAGAANTIDHFQKLDGEVGTAIAFCRGGAACVALNQGETASWSGNVNFSVPAGTYCNVIVSDDIAACPKIEVASDGSASIEVPPKGAVAIHSGKFAPPPTTTDAPDDRGHTSWLGFPVVLLIFGTWLH